MHSTLGSWLTNLGRIITVALLLSLPALAAHANSCSCSSPYCSTSVSCSGACYAICGASCSSGCSGQGGGPFNRDPGGGALEWTGESISESVQLTLGFAQASAMDVSSQLSLELNAEVSFITELPISLDVKGMPALELLRELGHHGAVVIYRGLEGRSEDRLRGVASVFARGALSDRVSEMLTQLLGRQVRFIPNSNLPLSIEAKDMPVFELLEAISSHGEIKFN